MVRIGGSNFDLDDIAELSAMLCRAPSSVILRRDATSDELSVVARYGFVNGFSNDPPPQRLFVGGEKMIVSLDVQNDPRLIGHQLQLLSPAVRTLIGVKLTPPDVVGQVTLAVFNAPLDFFESDLDFSRYAKFVMMLQGQFDSKSENDLLAAFQPGYQFNEERVLAKASVSNDIVHRPMDPAAKFLFETLTHKQALHARNGASYISLRTWKKTIKEYQIAALSAVKMFPPESFVDKVADEMASHAVRLFGSHSLTAIVPVPGGSSQTEQSLSEKLAACVAEKLSLPCQFVLKPQLVAKGKSHPSKNAKLKPYDLQQPVQGTVLLIDDVATSGRHIELAQTAIRQSGQDCFALSWIGP
jgi:hypothetical protein